MKHTLAAMSICLMLVSAFLASSLVTVQAYLGPPYVPPGGWPEGQPYFTVYLVLNTIDLEGEHAIALSIQEELAKIGIEVRLDYREEGVIDETVWDAYWDIPWADAPNLGWDMYFWEFWGMPIGLLWFTGMYHITPPYGWQIMGWNNTRAYELLLSAFEEYDPATRREYMRLYQREYVHDNPAPIIYAPTLIEVSDARFQTTWGEPAWDPAAWVFDPFLYTWVEDPMPEPVVLKWGDNQDLVVYNPMYMWNYAQDMLQSMTHNMLYVISKNESLAPPAGEGYIVKPALATGPPIWSEDYLTADVYLRDDVYWHEFHHPEYGPPEFEGQNLDYGPLEEQFTADDVVCTFEALMDPATRTWCTGDFIDVLDTSVYPGGVEKVSDFHVRFHLLAPYSEFMILLANEWGSMIVPDHILGGVPHEDWYRHWTNTEVPPPGTGPFQWVTRVPGEYWKIKVNPYYPEELGGQHPIDEIYFYVITDPAAGWTALTTHAIHFGDCWDATPAQLEAADLDPTLNVYDAPIPCTRNLALNLHHPQLSNRYVRQAIAHAINYPHIVETILPMAGLKGDIQAGPVWPMMEWAFDPTLPDYEYNITKAQQYMDMWLYSQAAYAPPGSAEVALGPVGDTDFSGFVELPDFFPWMRNFGTTPGDWPWIPGRDIDPDFDNTEFVEMDDFYMWTGAWGSYYPFKGAR